jgi:hypothetical protein
MLGQHCIDGKEGMVDHDDLGASPSLSCGGNAGTDILMDTPTYSVYVARKHSAG